MKKVEAAEAEDSTMEARVAEECALIEAQRALQRLVNARGLKYRDLAHRMRVSEARISHLFGDDPTNLTLRTMAKAFHVLGEEVVIMARSELERALSEARGEAQEAQGTWHVPAPDFVLWDQSATENHSVDERSVAGDTDYSWTVRSASAGRRAQR